MYSWSPNLSQISLKKIPLGKWFFKFWPKSKCREMKIGYLAAILKRYKYFIFFSWNMVVISVYIYGVKMIKKFRWESGFLKGGSMEPSLCTNGSAGYLMQLSVKELLSFKDVACKIITISSFSVVLNHSYSHGHPLRERSCDSRSAQIIVNGSEVVAGVPVEWWLFI